MQSKRRLKANLVLAGIRQSDIARNIGVSRSAVCNVLGGKSKSRKIEKAIKDALAAHKEVA